MSKKANRRFCQKGISQLIIIIVGVVLILGIGGVAVFMIERTKTLESEIETLKSKQIISPEKREGILQGQAGAALTPSLERQAEIDKEIQRKLEEEKRRKEEEAKREEEKRQEEERKAREYQEFVEKFRPETVVKLENMTEDKRTETFMVEDSRIAIKVDHFYIALDNFPSIDKPAFYRISLYKTGESNPIWTHQDEITREQLEDFGWTPEWTGMGSKPAGTAGGIAGEIIYNKTGEFYFDVKVKNVDSWFLEVEKIISPFGQDIKIIEEKAFPH